MRRRIALMILTTLVVSTASPAPAQKGSDYPVCMVYSMDGDHVECSFTSVEQCRQSASGRQAACFANPHPRAAPAPTAPIDPPLPAARPKR